MFYAIKPDKFHLWSIDSNMCFYGGDIGQWTSIKCCHNHQQSFHPICMSIVCVLLCRKIEDAFYGNKLRLNGLRLIKKSKTVSDTLKSVTYAYI